MTAEVEAYLTIRLRQRYPHPVKLALAKLVIAEAEPLLGRPYTFGDIDRLMTPPDEPAPAASTAEAVEHNA